MSTQTKEVNKTSQNRILLWGGIFILVTASYLWRIKVFNNFPFSYDEGIHIILSKLWARGYPPYEKIFVSYPPVFLWSLGIPWKLFNQLSAIRLLMSTYAIVGIIAVVYIGSVYHSHLAGLAAGILLSFSPDYFIPSVAIMGEAPSIGVVVAAIALAEKYRRSDGWRGWLVLTGGVLAFGLSLKILPFYAIPFIGFLVITRRVTHWTTLLMDLQASKRVLIRDLTILAGSFLIVFLLPFLAFNFSALYDQVVGMRLASRDAAINPFDSNNKDIINSIFSHPELTALALYGLAFVIVRKLKTYWGLVTWFILIWFSMYFHVPLRGKHLIIFLPILAIVAGFAIAHIFYFLKGIRSQPISLRTISMLIVIIVTMGMFSWNIPEIIAKNNGDTLDVEENEERLNAINFIDKIAMPDDCVIADNPVFLDSTNRLPPPELSETSQTRIDTGYLTLQDIVQAIETYNCHVVAVVTPRFGESIPGLSEWLADNYLGLYAQSETFVYFAKKGADNNYAPIPGGDLGGLVQLYGIRMSEQPWHLGEAEFISLYWQLKSPIQDKLIEKITLHNAIGQVIHQVTHIPFEGQFDPAKWHIDEQVRDTFQLELPGNLPAGTYDLYISLCLSETEACLPVNNDSGQTELYLGQIILEPNIHE